MANEAVVVFTAKCVERIVREGGSSAWRLHPGRARRCAYVVCTRNAHAKWVEGNEDHRSAFLVGKVKDVIPSEATPENEEAEENRFLLEFSEFARVTIPDIWQQDRNPVRYSTLEDLGINPSDLHWEPMPNSAPSASAGAIDRPYSAAARPLSLAEAKRGLALTFGVSPESVEITIRG